MIRSFLLTAAILWGASAASDPALQAREQLLAAADLLAEAKTARDRVDALTDAVRAYEAGVQAMRGELRRLTLQERAVTAALADEDSDISALLALLQNASRQTENQSLLHPGSAVDTIRAGTLASALVPRLTERARDLEAQLTTLNELRILIEAAKSSVLEGLSGVQEARVALADALSDRDDLPPRLATNAAAMEALVNSAETLSALADSLGAGLSGAEETAERNWLPPVTGKILAGYAPDQNRPGWSVSTVPGALLTSPSDVTVRYSGDFPKRGTVVILEADDRMLVLMAGLSVSFVTLGDVLAAGDPVGLAGDGQSAAQDNLNAEDAPVSLSAEETVYIELRQGGVPVDPATRLTLEQEQG